MAVSYLLFSSLSLIMICLVLFYRDAVVSQVLDELGLQMADELSGMNLEKKVIQSASYFKEVIFFIIVIGYCEVKNNWM